MHERTMRTMPREGFAIAWLQAPPVFKHATILTMRCKLGTGGAPNG
jgi:hypothetical protein